MQSESFTARPETNVDFVCFQYPTQIETNKQFLSWLQEAKISRDQILSITTNETDIEDGDQMLTVYFREKSIVKNPVPCDAIQFAYFELFQSWEDLTDDANQVMRESVGADIIALTRSPKNVGDARNQVVYYSKESGSGSNNLVTVKEFASDSVEYVELLNDVKHWMNTYIPPHLLVSVTCHEDSHPNYTKMVRVIVTHKAGPNPVKLADSAAKKAMPAEGLYNLQIFKVNDEKSWDDVQKQAKDWINVRGGQEGYTITSLNTSDDNGRAVAVYAWNGMYEAQIEEDLRPAGCCTIF